MRPANSYQSPSMTPPDEPDMDPEGRICSTSLCGRDAIDQDHYTSPLCEVHLKTELEWDRADRQTDRREEYGQYETDGSMS